MTANQGPHVVLTSVSKMYPTSDGPPLYAAHDVNLDIATASTVALTGVSGSGKSTVLHMIGAMDQPTSGSIVVDGTDLATLSGRRLADYRRSVGFIFQRFHLLPALSVYDNVMAPLLPIRNGKRLRGRVDELITAVGLAGREHMLPARLSGGQQQQVAIARALVTEPGLLLADEPTGNLDSAAGDDILSLLFEIQESRGMTMLIATHDPQVATRCGRLLRLRDGRVVDDTALPEEDLDLFPQIDRLRF